MNDSKISVRYAKALFQAAEEANVLDKVMQDVEMIMKVYAFPDFREVLDSPVVKTSDKKKVTQQLFSGKISSLSMSFFDLILSNKRESHLANIARNFKTLYKQNQGIISAEVVTAEVIEKYHIEQFRNLLKKIYKSEIELQEKIKPGILGGFILRVEDNQFDASVASGLNRIKKQLLESTIEK